MERKIQIKLRRHAELDSASSTLDVSQGNNNSVRGRSRIKYGMTSLFNNVGFTLIELLVVVLIIGILAAVALPQYEQSVMRSRFATLKTNATAIYKAQLVYYMANGEYSDDMEALSIDLADCTLSDDKKKCTFSWGKCEMITDNSENGSGRVSCYNTQTLKNGYAWYWKSPYYGPEACWVFSSDLNDKYHKLCEREGGTNLIQTTCGAAPLNVCHIYKLGS